MPRFVTTLILVAALVSAFAASAWATNAYISGNFTPGNWLTLVGLLLTFTGMIVAGVYWMSTQAGRSKINTELLIRLEELLNRHLQKFDEHVEHDAKRYSEMRDRFDEIHAQLSALREDRT